MRKASTNAFSSISRTSISVAGQGLEAGAWSFDPKRLPFITAARQRREWDFEAAWNTAGARSIENAALNLTYARNQLLPGLSLTARYAGNGISGTRILYQDPYSDIIIGKIDLARSRGLQDIPADKFARELDRTLKKSVKRGEMTKNERRPSPLEVRLWSEAFREKK